ncbi:MAG: hypothetical protein A2600_04005 [Candidatus Lambdaproteobacteria bacterium RIFOXYD1_FULL_56_27]|uniref:Co-chaperone DjlA N-terminal domain-containing protein n=1 Tax=Candidatus Lambdaproteobacteria bacterium RIFOXYD2_FULL_56_26 TaxID=1817773 RepID=A0A1F6H3H8_9PROT|nr:MAG: hypothetical protein A2426_01805 [Candidatus Lambdaproteobacteria bacterium RIFOXYC1_FULL_56_13]OGH04921.1 MAG: hypothetical protein A2557_08070 [Candidatus Lambdaproteobacteria bacterium RIFOXYD2_FULL_56_26]OGH09385.1 MAG: hypothetical protein A2600_04005 [Candidatus Lambdaproteobacteria bacterium RIFOXYD1_FULL_56_27]
MITAKTTIKDLHVEERKWLYTAIWKVVVVDKHVSAEEFEDLREAMNWVRQEEMEELEKQAVEKYSLCPLEPLPRLSFEKAFLMINEVIRVATEDRELLISEQELIEHFARLLGFTDDPSHELILGWAQKMLELEIQKEALAHRLKPFFSAPKS